MLGIRGAVCFSLARSLYHYDASRETTVCHNATFVLLLAVCHMGWVAEAIFCVKRKLAGRR